MPEETLNEIWRDIFGTPNAAPIDNHREHLAEPMHDLLEVWRDSYRITNPLYARVKEILAIPSKDRTPAETKELEHLRETCADEAIRRDRVLNEALCRVHTHTEIDTDDRIGRHRVLKIVAGIFLPMLDIR